MFFNTIQYLVFLPLVLLVYYLTAQKYRWLVLFLSSCVFYMYFIPRYILCLFFLIGVDYAMALKIHAERDTKRRKLYLLLSIFSNFGLLFYFKYLGFFTEGLNLLLAGTGKQLPTGNEILPIGLSFHTFQSVSYIVDVYRGKQQPERHLGIYAAYVLFFPQMVAGPIERFSTLGRELRKPVRFRLSFLKRALPLFLIGLFYKTVIADNCGAYVNATYAQLALQNQWNVFAAIALFSIQIYSDFFGYSLMAQASARLFGIRLIDNFAFPFFSANIIEFWKKWHLSLTAWFRDYVYIPLGGNRTSFLRHLCNIVVIFLLSGLWHGAGINFVLWGLLHGLAYVALLLYFKGTRVRLPRVLGCLLTFVLVSFIFVFFRNGNLTDSLAIFRQAFASSSASFTGLSPILLFNLAVLVFVEVRVSNYLNYSLFLKQNTLFSTALLLAYMFLAVLAFSGVDNLPFIYFQF